MQGPPNRRTPPILFTRPTHEWLSRVDQRQKQLAALDLSCEQRERLIRRNEIEFVYSTLRLEGLTVAREEIADLVFSAAKPNESGKETLAILEVVQSLQTIEALIQSRGREAELTSDLLLNLNRAGSFRTTAGRFESRNQARASGGRHRRRLPLVCGGVIRRASSGRAGFDRVAAINRDSTLRALERTNRASFSESFHSSPRSSPDQHRS